MIDENDYVFSDNRSDAHGFRRTGERVRVEFRPQTWDKWDGGTAARFAERDVYVDSLGDRFVADRPRERFCRLGDPEAMFAYRYAYDTHEWSNHGDFNFEEHGGTMVRKAESEGREYDILQVYPPEVDGAMPKAFLWAIDLDDVMEDDLASILSFSGLGRDAKAAAKAMAEGQEPLAFLEEHGAGLDDVAAAAADWFGPGGWMEPETYDDVAYPPGTPEWGSISAEQLETMLGLVGALGVARAPRPESLAGLRR